MSGRHHNLVDLVCLVQLGEEITHTAVDQALVLAQTSGAYLKVVVAVHHFKAPYTPFMSSVSASLAAEVNEGYRQKANVFIEEMTKKAADRGVKFEIEPIIGAFDEVAAQAARAARAADLVVVDQQHGALDRGEVLLEEALFHSGRPVLVASPQVKPASGSFQHAAIGWNGSQQVVRATSDALAAFPSLKKITLVNIGESKKIRVVLPAADFARHLARCGLEVELSVVKPSEGQSIARALELGAKKAGADLLVMGAFGQSRLREFLFGGVTVELTAGAALPLLMAY